jgi:hypothetical protein
MGGRSYSTTRTRAYSTATTTKVSHETMVREELLSLPEFKPVFITAITFLQFVIFCGMVLQSLTQNQFAKWGLDVNGATCDGDCPLSANSTTLVGSIKIEPVNPVSVGQFEAESDFALPPCTQSFESDRSGSLQHAYSVPVAVPTRCLTRAASVAIHPCSGSVPPLNI